MFVVSENPTDPFLKATVSRKGALNPQAFVRLKKVTELYPWARVFRVPIGAELVAERSNKFRNLERQIYCRDSIMDTLNKLEQMSEAQARVATHEVSNFHDKSSELDMFAEKFAGCWVASVPDWGDCPILGAAIAQFLGTGQNLFGLQNVPNIEDLKTMCDNIRVQAGVDMPNTWWKDHTEPRLYLNVEPNLIRLWSSRSDEPLPPLMPAMVFNRPHERGLSSSWSVELIDTTRADT